MGSHTDPSIIVSEIKEAMGAISEATKLYDRLSKHEICKNERKRNPIIEKVFSVHVNRTLMGNAPVRHVRFKKVIDCVTALGDILKDITFVGDIVLKASSYVRLKRMLRRQSQYSSFNILVRSLLTMALYFDGLILGQFDPRTFVREAMLSKAIPSELLDSLYGEAFVGRLIKPLYDSLKLFTLNRYRQKECIDSLLLPDWGVLQQEAKAVDFHFREEKESSPSTVNFPLTNWVLQETLEFMEKSISMAIQTKLFQEELDSAFWYRDFILSTQLNILTYSIADAKEQNKVSNENYVQYGKNKKGKKQSGVSVSKAHVVSLAEHEDNVDFVFASVRRTLCRGIFRFMMAVRQSNLSPVVRYEFTTKETIISKRFEQFSCIDQPSLLTYDDYIQGSDFSKVDPQRLLSAALECFNAAKSLIDQLVKTLDVIKDESFSIFDRCDTVKLRKVCVGNTVFLQKLGNILKEDNASQHHNVVYEFDHSEFCIIKIV